MIKFTVLYPRVENAFFDFEYYLSHHLALTQRLLGSAMQKFEVEKGISGSEGTPAPYVAIGSLYFESLEKFKASFLVHLEELRNDMPKFTNIPPLIQIGEVLQ